MDSLHCTVVSSAPDCGPCYPSEYHIKTFFQDSELKLLRSTLLCSIRTAAKTASQDVCDTDVPDLDALREAALKSLNNQARQNSDVSTLSNSSSSKTSIVEKVVNVWVPRFRLRPQRRSNSVVIHTVPLGSRHVEATPTSFSVGDHFQESPFQANSEECHWTKNDRNRHDAIKDEYSEDEILTVDSVHSDPDEDHAKSPACTAALKESEKNATTPAIGTFEHVIGDRYHSKSSLLSTDDTKLNPTSAVTNDCTPASTNRVRIDCIERELSHLKPGFEIELLGFDDACADHTHDDHRVVAAKLESESKTKSSKEDRRNALRPKIVGKGPQPSCNVRCLRRQSRSPSRKVTKRQDVGKQPQTSMHSRRALNRRSSSNEISSKRRTGMHSFSSIAVKHNCTNETNYKPRFFALSHTYSRRTRFDSFV